MRAPRAELSTASRSVQYYLEQSVAASTQSSYDTGVRSYQQYCEQRAWCPDDLVTTAKAEEWIAALADHNRVAASTIRVYRSALSTWHEQRTAATSHPNPVQHPRISRIIAGIERAQAPAAAARIAAQPKTEGVTVAMIEQLASYIKHADTSDRARMMLAAAALATCAALRPSELLGSAQHPTRAITLDQLVFYRDAEGRQRIPASCCYAEQYGATVPDHAQLTLHISKSNQRGAPQCCQVAAPTAVAALWEWCHRRGSDRTHGAQLFRLPGYKPLAHTKLVRFVQAILRALGHTSLRLTGKCFRVGAASTLSRSGADAADIAVLGRWAPNSSVWRRYADPASNAERAREVNRKLA